MIVLTFCTDNRREIALDEIKQDTILPLHKPSNEMLVKAQLDSQKYKYLLNYFDFEDDSQKELYNHFYRDKLKSAEQVVPPNNYKGIIGKWIEVRIDSGKFCFYRRCEFVRRWVLTDSAFINYYTDGPVPEIIQEVNLADSNYIIKTNRSVLQFSLISKNEKVYKLNDGSSTFLIAPVEQVATMNVLNESCSDTP